MPGTVAGLALAEEKYGSGRFTLADLIAPAIALARDGMNVTAQTLAPPPFDPLRLKRWPSSAKIFLKADGSAFSPGDRLVQTDLANSLEAIAKRRAARLLPRSDRAADRGRRSGGRRRHDGR